MTALSDLSFGTGNSIVPNYTAVLSTWGLYDSVDVSSRPYEVMR